MSGPGGDGDGDGQHGRDPLSALVKRGDDGVMLESPHDLTPDMMPHPQGAQGMSLVEQRLEQRVRVSYGVMTDPQSLTEYEGAIPGAGKQILDKYFAQAEREQEHRHKMERDEAIRSDQLVQAVVSQGNRGQLIGGVVALAGFALMAYMAQLGHPNAAVGFGFIELTALVGVFVYGKKKQTEEAIAAVKADAESEKIPSLPPKNSDPPKSSPSNL